MTEDNKLSGENFMVELAKAKSDVAPMIEMHTMREHTQANEPEGQLAIDVYQNKTKDEIIVQATLAGLKENDIDIHITTNSLTISGMRERSETVEDKDYLYQECFWGKFSRSIILPYEVDSENSVATFKNGILTIRLPKLDHTKKMKKLKIES